jgi:hypothetical protein
MRLWGHFTLDDDLNCFYDYWSDGSVWTLALMGSDAQSIEALEDEATYDRAYAYAHRIFFKPAQKTRSDITSRND